MVQALASPDLPTRERAFGTLVSIYWKPVYKYLRMRWGLGHEDSEDLTQDFFGLAFVRGWLAGFDPGRARFRTFLRTCLDGHASNWRRAERRAKRGGQFAFDSLDFAGAERELADSAPLPDADVEAYFQREWVKAVFEQSIARLRRECEADGKQHSLTLFLRYDVEPASTEVRPSYADLAREYALPETQVTNFLAWSRRRFRAHVLESLAELTGSEAEYVEAVRELLGASRP